MEKLLEELLGQEKTFNGTVVLEGLGPMMGSISRHNNALWKIRAEFADQQTRERREEDVYFETKRVLYVFMKAEKPRITAIPPSIVLPR